MSSDGNLKKSVQPQAHHSVGDGNKRKVINALSVERKKEDEPILIDEEFESAIKEATAYVFPTLAEKEKEKSIQSILTENSNDMADRFEFAQEEINPNAYEDLNQNINQEYVQNSEDISHEQPSVHRQTQDGLHHVQPMGDISGLYEDMIQKSIQESSRILEEAHAKAQEDYNRMMEQGRISIEEDRQAAINKGISEGTRSQVANIRSCIEQLEHAVARIEGNQENYFANCDKDLKWLALEIASKILNTAIETDDAILYPLVQQALAKQKNAKWLTLEVSENAPNLIQKLNDELAKGENAITVTETDSPIGTCKIQTHEGFIDASLYRQLENLKDYFMADDYQ